MNKTMDIKDIRMILESILNEAGNMGDEEVLATEEPKLEPEFQDLGVSQDEVANVANDILKKAPSKPGSSLGRKYRNVIQQRKNQQYLDEHSFTNEFKKNVIAFYNASKPALKTTGTVLAYLNDLIVSGASKIVNVSGDAFSFLDRNVATPVAEKTGAYIKEKIKETSARIGVLAVTGLVPLAENIESISINKSEDSSDLISKGNKQSTVSKKKKIDTKKVKKEAAAKVTKVVKAAVKVEKKQLEISGEVSFNKNMQASIDFINSEYQGMNWFLTVIKPIIYLVQKIVDFIKMVWNKISGYFENKNTSVEKSQQTSTKSETTKSFLHHLGVLEADEDKSDKKEKQFKVSKTQIVAGDAVLEQTLKKAGFVVLYRVAMMGFWLAMIKYLGGMLVKAFVMESEAGNKIFGFIYNNIQKAINSVGNVFNNPASTIFHIICGFFVLYNFYKFLVSLYHFIRVWEAYSTTGAIINK